jgi:hypothetical protein
MDVAGGELSFISTLDNTDFQNKSLEDLRLIKLRLELTGDTSGITNYDAAVKAALASEIQVRESLAAILQDARDKTAEFTAELQKPVTNTTFDTVTQSAEVATEAISTFAEAGSVSLSGVDALVKALNDDFAAGTITATEFKEAMDAIGTFDTFKQQEIDAIAAKQAIQDEVGIIGELKIALAELKAENLTIVDPEALAASNLKIQEVSAELTRATNVGKLGFDEFGEKIIVVNEEIQTSIGLIGSLQAELKLLQTQKIDIVDTNKLTQVNAVIQDLQLQIAQLQNKGKAGFDELGNSIESTSDKQGKFGAAIGRATDLSTIGSRAVTQLSRQIIGLGVGFLSLYIGAKAFESLAEYISQLDIFNPIATEAAMRSKAFTDAVVGADYTKAIESVTQLGVNLELAKQGFIDKDGVIDEYNNTIGKVAGRVDTLTQAEDGNAKNAANFIRLTLLKAASQIILADAAKDAADTAVKNQKIQDDIDSLKQSKIDAVNAGKKNPNGIDVRGTITGADKDIKSDLDAIDSNNKRLQQGYDKRLAIITNFDTQQASLTKGFGQSPTDGGTDGAGVSAVATLKNQLANDTLNRQKQQSENILSDDTQTYAKRLVAINNFYNASKAIDTNNEQLALSNKKLSSDQRLHIENDYGDKVLELQKTRQDQLRALKKSTDKTDPAVALLASQTKLEQDIAALKDKAAADDTTRDQKSLLAINAKYTKQYNAVVAHNKLIQAYWDSHPVTSKAGAQLNTIDPASVTAGENTEIDNQANTNENEYIQQDIEKKKKLYADYQTYRLKVGSTIADADYSDLLKSGKDFNTYLANIEASIDKTDTSGPIQARLAMVQKYEALSLEDQKKQLDAVIAANVDYQTKRQIIIQKANDDLTLLQLAKNNATDQASKDFYDHEIAQVQQNEADQLTAIDESNFKKLDSYKALFDGLVSLTDTQAKKLINNLYQQETSAVALTIAGLPGGISIEAYLQNIKSLDAAGLALKNKFPSELEAVGTALQSVSGDLSGLAPSISADIGLLGKLVSGYGSLTKSINDASKAQAGSKEQFADYASAAVSAIGIVVSVASVLANATAKSNAEYIAEQKTENDNQLKAIEAVNKAIERQITLAGTLYDSSKISDYVDALNKITAAQKVQQDALVGKVSFIDPSTVAPDKQDEIEAANKLITLFNQDANNRAADESVATYLKLGNVVDLSTQSLEQLQVLLDSGKLDDSTAGLVTSLIDLQNQYQDTLNTLNATAVGSDFSTLLDNLTSLFSSATTQTQDFADNFQSIIQKAVLQSFQSQYLADNLQTFYTDLANDAKVPGGLTPTDIATLQQEYNDLVAKGQADFINIEKVTGVDLTDSGTGASSSPTTAQGEIQQAVTETTASLMMGTLNGIQLSASQIRDLNAEMVQQGLQSIALLTGIQTNTGKTADNTSVLPAILSALNNAKTNQANSAGSVLRAAGKLGY